MSETEIRTDLFIAVQQLSDVVPEMRAGQLIAAIGELCADLHGRRVVGRDGRGTPRGCLAIPA